MTARRIRPWAENQGRFIIDQDFVDTLPNVLEPQDNQPMTRSSLLLAVGLVVGCWVVIAAVWSAIA